MTRPNRFILLLIAVLLLAGAAIVLLAAAGLLELPAPAELYGEAEASAAVYPWAWVAGSAAAGVVLAALGAWLVRRQLRFRRSERLSTVVLQRGDRGRTTVKATAVTDMAAADLGRVRGVQDSKVRFLTFGARPRLLVQLDVDEDASLREVLERTEPAHERLSRHLGVDGVHVETIVRPSTEAARRVQ